MGFVSAVIVAGGMGKRMKSSLPKQFLKIGADPVLGLTLSFFDSMEKIDEIVIVLPEDHISFFKKEIFDKKVWKKSIQIVAGGKERQDSVKNGLDQISEKSDIVLVHDGVRPFIEKEDIEKLIKESYSNDAVIPCLSISETVKKSNKSGFVSETVPRENLYLAQTPQAFKTEILKLAHKKADELGIEATDDSLILEKLGYKVKIIKGNRKNIKITTPEDLDFAVNYLLK